MIPYRTLRTGILFGALALGAACSDKPVEKPPLNEAAVVSVELRVEGMVCEGCQETISEEVSKLTGVKSCTASHEAKNATISYDPGQTSPGKLAEAITKLGYKATAP